MNTSQNVLASIIEHKQREVEAYKASIPISQLKKAIVARELPRGFKAKLRTMVDNGRAAVIAECKQASPSKGIIRENYDVSKIAASYQIGGAACISVLTDEKYFKGTASHLDEAKRATTLPILRKDFILDRYQIFQARAIGADCILLIASILDSSQMTAFSEQARQLGMDVLLEIHNADELAQALQIESSIIGINNRNLKNFQTDIEISKRLVRKVPSERLVVSESGIHSTQQVAELRNAGIHTFLVGESLMRAPDPGVALREIFEFENITSNNKVAVL